MWEWINKNAAGVQAASTLFLAVLTAYYIYWVRRGVRENRELVEHQAGESKKRDRQQIERAIQTMITELEFNSRGIRGDFTEPLPLLNAAYDSCLWAVQLIDMLPTTFRALGEAYSRLRNFEIVHYAAITRPEKRGPGADGFLNMMNDDFTLQEVHSAIERALEELGKDPATKHFLTSTSTTTNSEPAVAVPSH